MTTNRTATIADVVHSVLTSDAGGRLTQRQAGDAVHIALRTVIGLNCMSGRTLDIDLGNGHFLQCSLKRAVGPTAFKGATMPKAIKASKPMKLQANTAGAWKDVITFDGADDTVTSEVMNNAHYIGIHDSGNASFRITAIDPLIGTLAHWTRADGWKEKRHAAA